MATLIAPSTEAPCIRRVIAHNAWRTWCRNRTSQPNPSAGRAVPSRALRSGAFFGRPQIPCIATPTSWKAAAREPLKCPPRHPGQETPLRARKGNAGRPDFPSASVRPSDAVSTSSRQHRWLYSSRGPIHWTIQSAPQVRVQEFSPAAQRSNRKCPDRHSPRPSPHATASHPRKDERSTIEKVRNQRPLHGLTISYPSSGSRNKLRYLRQRCLFLVAMRRVSALRQHEEFYAWHPRDDGFYLRPRAVLVLLALDAQYRTADGVQGRR